MRVLVTGAAGFIGSATCARLRHRGDEVVGLDNFDDAYDPAFKRANAARLDVPIRDGDVRDRAAVDAALVGVDAVVHLAARAGVRRSFADPGRYQSVNVDGTATLLAAMAARGVARLVFGSSSSVYGARVDGPFRESDPADSPLSPYAATKRAGERLCAAWADRTGASAACLRFFTVYGPEQPPEMAIARFVRQILADEPVTLFGDGGSRRDHTEVDDVVAGVVAALDRPPGGAAVINLGSGSPVRLDALVRQIGEVTGRSPRVRFAPEQPGDVPLTWADRSLAHERLGWTPQVTLADGLRRVAQRAASRSASTPARAR